MNKILIKPTIEVLHVDLTKACGEQIISTYLQINPFGIIGKTKDGKEILFEMDISFYVSSDTPGEVDFSNNEDVLARAPESLKGVLKDIFDPQ